MLKRTLGLLRPALRGQPELCSASKRWASAGTVGTANVIDGKGIAEEIAEEIKQKVQMLKEKYDQVPGLAVLQVGGRPDSSKYVEMKRKKMRNLGFQDFGHCLPEQITQDALLSIIKHYNEHPQIHGILVQLPVPDHIDQNVITQAIIPEKDVDGFHPVNVGYLALNQGAQNFRGKVDYIQPCTPKGCIELLDRCGIEISGKSAVVLGRSNIVGHPVANLLLHRNATVTICHSRTPDIADRCREADIVVGAIGKAEFVKGDWIKEGAVVIDVGINFKEVEITTKSGEKKKKQKMCGDVDYAACAQKASWITPVPGGVGPMTVAMLMQNTVDNAERYFKKFYRPPWFVRM